jgi:hypothetical protein
MNFLNICLNIPNLDTIGFYIIFVLIIPGQLFMSEDYQTLQYYLPALIMAAVTLTESGSPDLFINLYPTECLMTSFSGFLSTNIINCLAIVGILLQCLTIASATSSITLGLVTGIIIFAVTFPLAQQILPFFIKEVDELAKNKFSGINFPGSWHKYMAGTIFSIFLLCVQYVMLIAFTKYILSTGLKLI